MNTSCIDGNTSTHQMWMHTVFIMDRYKYLCCGQVYKYVCRGQVYKYVCCGQIFSDFLDTYKHIRFGRIFRCRCRIKITVEGRG